MIKIKELGIVKSDGIYFHQASEFARENLEYIHAGARYECEYPYKIDRDFMDSLLFFWIMDGEMEFEYLNEKKTAKTGDIVLLDCKEHNLYYAKRPVKFQWFHLSGGASQALYEKIYESVGWCISENLGNSEAIFNEIFNMIKNYTVDDFYMSSLIHQLMCGIISGEFNSAVSETMLEVIEYMQKNYSSSLTVQGLADRAHISLYHFSRRFKRETGTPPHAYLLSIRIRNAKRLLIETEKSVESIGLSTGFNSASHFVRTFQKQTGQTPLEFRRMKL